MVVQVKTEIIDQGLSSADGGGGSAAERRLVRSQSALPEFAGVIELSSSSDEDEEDGGGSSAKRPRVSGEFLDVLPLETLPPPPTAMVLSSSKQFWKAGDYEGTPQAGDWNSRTGGMDHLRVHPKFLHSNATSHKWSLGAVAELLDNALDEVSNGATYVNLDMLVNKKEGTPMMLIEDNGGGMDPDKMRQCMSLGYSAKSKLANTIGQYGNGFKTSTMRLGADVIVFSRSPGKDGTSPTQSIGLLSYTFLRSTGKEDIVVPILDYEWKDGQWNKIIRSSPDDWNRNVETMVEWSPFSSEAQLLQQFNMMKERGTRVIIYNLWEDDQGQLELDFESERHDIQIRGVNRDEKSIKMADEYPNSRHFLTYRHSLRSYVSILYLRLPPNFRIILRGKDIEHHNIVNDMMLTQEVTYRPQAVADGVPRDSNMVATVTIGFVKDAKSHVDVQGFNVYHKNRLIKPFWRVWNASGSDGRGVIGLLEANFVEPAHDKQGFERTTVLARLETKLLNMQKNFWNNYCHKIGYAPRRNKSFIQAGRESSPEYQLNPPSQTKRKFPEPVSRSHPRQGERASAGVNGNANGKSGSKARSSKSNFKESSPCTVSSSEDNSQTDELERRFKGSENVALRACRTDGARMIFEPVPLGYRNGTCSDVVSEQAMTLGRNHSSDLQVVEQLQEENRQLRERLDKREEEIMGELIHDLRQERDKRSMLENQLREAEAKIQELNTEQDNIINIFSEERDKRDLEEDKLRQELKEKSTAITELMEKVKVLESSNPRARKF